MMFLCILFIPPVYFIARGKWGGFVINSFFYGIACFCALSLIFLWAAPFFWVISFLHASWHRRQEKIVEHAELLATKMAEKLRPAQNSPPPPQN